MAEAFAYAHELGLATILWCYLRNSVFKKDKDYHVAADLTGQANHLGVTIQADIIKQKLPENNGGYLAMNEDGVKYGRFDEKMYVGADHRPPDRPDPLAGRELLHGPQRPDQQRRRVRRQRLRRRRAHGGHQQAGGRHRADLRAQGVPAPEGGRDPAAQPDPGRLPRPDEITLA